ncbi:hypothetical protein TorRG33x02_271340 [Trema orientale]|uniref:Uncharacterized protein n=1 Tax=Trema orientale TaxID=63057 RepID=A0A2P5CW22_TREOI|nr:hypothetical protein TorRG33x02_271340 [Trema orientale]
MGNESYLQSVAQKIVGSVKGAKPVEVVGLDMEEEREAAFDAAVDKACKTLGNLDAFVHSYTYEGSYGDEIGDYFGFKAVHVAPWTFSMSLFNEVLDDVSDNQTVALAFSHGVPGHLPGFHSRRWGRCELDDDGTTLSNEPPALANSGVGDDALPRRPGRLSSTTMGEEV